MNTAEQLLNDALIRAAAAIEGLPDLRRVVEGGLPEARGRLIETALLNFRILAQIPELGVARLSEAQRQELAESMSGDQVNRALLHLTAAELVFHHTLVDSVAIDCCEAISLLDPSRVAALVRDRSISLQEAVGASHEQLEIMAAKAVFQKHRNESLPRRAAWLHTMCRASEPGPIVERYDFEGDRLLALDRMRHAVVHGDAHAAKAATQDDMHFLKMTSLYLVQLVMKSYGLKIDSEYTAAKLAQLRNR